MTEESNTWQDIKVLLEQIEESMLSTLPAEGVSVTLADSIAVGIYWRCMSLFRSIILLLSNNQPEEALMLWRPLFTDSLRIRELEAAGKKDRIAIQLGHFASSLERTKDRAQEAKRQGITDDITKELAQIEKQKRALEGYRKKLGIDKLKQFSSEKNLIKKLNLKVDFWTFLYSHGFVHGEDIAQIHRRRRIEHTSVLAFFSHTADPELLGGVGLAAAQLILDTHESAGKMLGWETSPELPKLLSAIKSRLGES